MPVGRCVRRTAESVTLTCWPPGAARSIRVDPQILFVDLDFDVFRKLRPDVDRRERRVAPRGLIERRDAHEPVHARFGRQQAVGILAGQDIVALLSPASSPG